MISYNNIRRFAIFYLAFFLATFAWLYCNDLLLSEFRPQFFVNKLDFTWTLLQLTGIQQLLISFQWLRIVFDLFYLSTPILLLYAVYRKSRILLPLALITAFFALIYNLCVSALCFISMETFLPWILIPLAFASTNSKQYYFNLLSIRLVFVTVMIIAAGWKLINGGLFNPEQMSAILVSQYADYFAGGTTSMKSKVVLFLIDHKLISYIFYLLGFIAEGTFVAGLFTRKFDKLLIIAFTSFVIFDYFLMGINYFGWLAFMGCFYFPSFKGSYVES